MTRTQDSIVAIGRLLGFSTLLISALIVFAGVSASTARAETDGYTEVQVQLSPTTSEEISLGHDEDTGVAVSPVITAQLDLVGFLWDTGTATEVFARVQGADGTWSGWAELGIHPDSEGQGNGTDPYWSKDSIGFQVAVVGEVTNFRAGIVVSPETQPSLLAEPSGDSLQATGPSFVKPRSAWDSGNDCRPPGLSLTYSDVQGVVVHHTVSKATSLADVPFAIDAICSFHVNGRGWDDIGYNAIVDSYGGVWEGRTGGLEAGISGAHAAGFNTSTQGVAMLGDFSTTPPTVPQEGALIDLLDWMTGWYLIDPSSNVTLYSRSDGPKFEEGESVTLPPVMGHRDLGVTSCPGDAGYARLPTIRASITPIPRTVAPSWGDELATYSDLTGRLKIENLHSSGIIDRPVHYQSVSTNWTSVEAVNLDGDGLDELLFYNSASGSLEIHELEPDGTLGAVVRIGTIGKNWDAVEPIDTDGDGTDEILFYRRSDGRFSFYDLQPTGFFGSSIRIGFFGTSWNTVEPIDLDADGADELAFYRRYDGRLVFYDVTSEGLLGSPVLKAYIAPGWTTIEPMDIDNKGDDEILFYRLSDGRAAFYEMTGTGQFESLIHVGNFPSQWTSITSPNVD
ncbi:MAG: N-acetylmuramoyl-L-alanine amidase [Acidimicrobiia bacterium]